MSKLFIPLKKAELRWHQGQPFSLSYNDIYHPAEGGLQQSLHVFIAGNDLVKRWQALANEPTKIFTLAEMGFGTGLNFLLSWYLWEQNAPSGCRLHFLSCEKHPMSVDELRQSLAAWPQLHEQAQQLLACYPILTPGYHHLTFCDGSLILTLMLGDALESYEQLLICGESKLEAELRNSYVDAWYLDGFSPAKNKNMWSDALIKIIAMLSKEGTTLATYTAAGAVRAGLQQHGFSVEKHKGFGHKRHMLSARFRSAPIMAIQRPDTPWHTNKSPKNTYRSAIIIGAGLAGCFTAYSLAKRGWNVKLIDELPAAGNAGSANPQAVFFPKLSAYNSPWTEFMLSAFLYAARTYQSMLRQKAFGELKGSLLLAYNEQQRRAQSCLAPWLAHYPELGRLLDAAAASELAGLPLTQSALFVPLSGWINSPALCQFLIETEGISLCTNTPVAQLLYDDKRWRVHNWEAEVLILANGHKIKTFQQTEYLPIQAIRGQMTEILSTKQSDCLQLPLCGEGHVLPAIQGKHHLGASYELKTALPTIKLEDDEYNLAKLGRLAPHTSWSNVINSHWAGIRATTPDYLPLVGKIADAHQFLGLFSGLKTNAKRWIAQVGPYYPGLYACAGFGSRGLTSIPLCAEWLAALINHEISCLPRKMQQSLSPARFLRKDIIRGLSLNDK